VTKQSSIRFIKTRYGFDARTDEIGSETCCWKPGSSFYFGYLTLNISDTGKIDQVEGVLAAFISKRQTYQKSLGGKFTYSVLEAGHRLIT